MKTLQELNENLANLRSQDQRKKKVKVQISELDKEAQAQGFIYNPDSGFYEDSSGGSSDSEILNRKPEALEAKDAIQVKSVGEVKKSSRYGEIAKRGR